MVDDVSASTTISIEHMGLDFTDDFTYLDATITKKISIDMKTDSWPKSERVYWKTIR